MSAAQQPTLDYATQLLYSMAEEQPPSSPGHMSPSLLPKLTITPLEITYSHVLSPLHKRPIIHDINSLTKRKRNDPPDTHRMARLKGVKGVKLETVPSPREQLQLIRNELHQSHEDNEEYLRHNRGTIKEKIRSKFMRHRTDPNDRSPPLPPPPSPSPPKPPQKTRIDRYNHDFEEYLIRKRIDKKSNSLPASDPQQNTPAYHSIDHLHQKDTPEERRERPWYASGMQGGREDGEPRLIIVSPIQPGHALAKLKHFLADTATKSASQTTEAQALLRRCSIDKVGASFERQAKRLQREAEKGQGAQGGQRERGRTQGVQPPVPPANFARRLNCALLKRQVNQVRKESIGLPLLLDSQESTLRQTLLQQRINARKISCMLTLPQEEAPRRKYVVYSKKNLSPREATGEEHV